MLLSNIISLPDLALILASLVGVAVLDGILCALYLNSIEGTLEAVFAGIAFAFLSKSIGDQGVVYEWIAESNFANWLILVLMVALIIIAIVHVIRIGRRIHRRHIVVTDDTTTPADTTEK